MVCLKLRIIDTQLMLGTKPKQMALPAAHVYSVKKTIWWITLMVIPRCTLYIIFTLDAPWRHIRCLMEMRSTTPRLNHHKCLRIKWLEGRRCHYHITIPCYLYCYIRSNKAMFLCCPQFLLTFFIFCKYLCVKLLILNRKKKFRVNSVIFNKVNVSNKK